MPVERLVRLVVLGLLGASLALSCAVDHRSLVAGPSYAGFFIIGGEAGQSGASSDGGVGHTGEEGGAGALLGGADAGGKETGGALGAGGSQTPPAVVDGCPDLDHNAKGDCTETLVKNPNFVADTQGWSPGDQAFIEWSTENHFDDLPSGSALVSANGYSDTDGMVQRAATQCVKSDGAAHVEVFANAFVKSGQGEGLAALSVFFFSSPDCSGSPSGAPLDAHGSLPDVWQTLNAKQSIPESTQSVLVRLAVSKPYRTMVFKALFDNVLIRTE